MVWCLSDVCGVSIVLPVFSIPGTRSNTVARRKIVRRLLYSVVECVYFKKHVLRARHSTACSLYSVYKSGNRHFDFGDWLSGAMEELVLDARLVILNVWRV